MLPAQRALISVYDKSGLEELARGLGALGVEIVSTGGTYRFLENAGIPVTPVADVTGHPEILGGRVKTLHPRIHGGILADRGRAAHLSELQEHGIGPIDLVVVNLYPFRETVASGAAFEEVIEMIDIGGPTMIRAAAKNFRGVTVVVDPGDYTQVLAALEDGDRQVPEALRRGLALKAFRQTQAYDAEIANWLGRQDDEDTSLARYPVVQMAEELRPRYGENPHQEAAVYRTEGGAGVFGGFDVLQGKAMSYNNFLDADAGRKLVASFEADPAVVILKHNNPCGVGRGDDLTTAYRRALECDPVSAFGSVIALNRPADGELAEAMADLFVEVVIAPEFTEEARQRFAAKRNLRLIRCPLYDPTTDEVEYRGIDGGFLAQSPDAGVIDLDTWEVVTERQPTEGEKQALELAWKTVRGVKSNAIVVALENRTLGIGAGQMSRVDSCRLAIEKAQSAIEGSVAASDAFFPFRDGLDVLAEAGVKAVAQPGGSRKDKEVIAAANEHGVAMMFTGRRHFRH